MLAIIFTIQESFANNWSDWQLILKDNAFSVGLAYQCLGFAIGHIFFHKQVSNFIGWLSHKEFQFEVGFASLAIAVLAFLTDNFSKEFYLATAIVSLVYFWGCAIGHIIDAVKQKNFNPGNFGFVFWWDLVFQIILVYLALRYK